MDRPVGQHRPRLINRRQQGDLGEASAIEWLVSLGATAFIPFGHSPDIDLVAEAGGGLVRIQVKTCTYRGNAPKGEGRWQVQLATNGGNQSWSRVAKTMDPSRIDFVFILAGDGRRWFIPATAIEGRHSIQVGGAKYSEFEIDRGRPISELVYGPDNATLESKPGPGEYRSGQPGGTVNAMAYAFAGSNPASPTTHDSQGDTRPHSGARTRISKNHQVTIPMSQFDAAELRDGDRFRVMAMGPGRIELTRVEELAGQLPLESVS